MLDIYKKIIKMLNEYFEYYIFYGYFFIFIWYWMWKIENLSIILFVRKLQKTLFIKKM